MASVMAMPARACGWLSEAAALTGRNATTINRAAKNGRLSSTVDEAGSRRFDTAELDRVYGIRINDATPNAMAPPMASPTAPEREIELMQRQLDDRDATIRELVVEKDARIRDQAETIADLRKRLDLLTALLPGPPRRPWWRWWR